MGETLGETVDTPFSRLLKRALGKVGMAPRALYNLPQHELDRIYLDFRLDPYEREALVRFGELRRTKTRQTALQMLTGLSAEIHRQTEEIKALERQKTQVTAMTTPALAGPMTERIDLQIRAIARDIRRKEMALAAIRQNSKIRAQLPANQAWEGTCENGFDPMFFTAGFQNTLNPDEAKFRMCPTGGPDMTNPDNYYWNQIQQEYYNPWRRNALGYPTMRLAGLPQAFPATAYNTSLMVPGMGAGLTKTRTPVSSYPVSLAGIGKKSRKSKKTKSRKSRSSRSRSRSRSRTRSRSRSRSRGIAL